MIHTTAQTPNNLILVTLDGLRWQELFGGADSMLIADPEYVKDTASLKLAYWHPSQEGRRNVLMPFFWKNIVEEGQLYGNRWHDNKVDCSNIFWFSYPGYAEILCGKTNAAAIHSNAKIDNPDTTILELLHQTRTFRGSVAAFGSWDVFPYIINEKRSGIPVNAGFSKAVHGQLSEREQYLNELQDQIPSPWSTVRLDAFTHHYAVEYMKQFHPRVVYISYGETDDFAHDGRYDHYLHATRRSDQFIAELWKFLQADSFYQGKTNMLITTDHGRGSWDAGGWKSHGKTYQGSNAIWLAAIGPDVADGGEMLKPMQLWQNQVAATCLQLLRQSDLITSEMGKPLNVMAK